jgi:Leucine Rich repeat
LLSLDQAGRCFGPQVVHDMIRTCNSASSSSSSSNSACQLAGLAIGGAYLLKDEDAAALITALKTTLVSLEFKACPLLGLHLCRSLASPTCNTNIASAPLVELSLQDLTFSPEAWAALLSSKSSSRTTTTSSSTSTSTATITTNRALSRLENLRLQQMTGLTDAMVAQLLQCCGKSLQRLDLSHNHDLTDSTLAAIRQYCCCCSSNSKNSGSDTPKNGNSSNGSSSRLRHLSLANLKRLTNAGLQALFTNVVVVQPRHDDAPTTGDDADNDATPAAADDDVVVVAVSDTPPPRLESLDLGRCDYHAVTDEVIDLVTQAAIATSTNTSASTKDGDDDNISPTALNAQKHSNTVGGLVRLNIQGASLVTDTSMEYLAATCANTLQDLNVSFCGRISNQGLGYLVDSSSSPAVLRKLHVWGCAQLSDEFFEGHSRVNDANLEILGAWMKSKHQETSTSASSPSTPLLASPL